MKYLISLWVLVFAIDWILRLGWPVKDERSINSNYQTELPTVSQKEKVDLSKVAISLFGIKEGSNAEEETIFDQVTADSIKSLGQYQLILYALSEVQGKQHAFLWIKDTAKEADNISSEVVYLNDHIVGAVVTELTKSSITIKNEVNLITLEMFKRENDDSISE